MARLYSKLLWLIPLGAIAGAAFGFLALVKYEISAYRHANAPAAPSSEAPR